MSVLREQRTTTRAPACDKYEILRMTFYSLLFANAHSGLTSPDKLSRIQLRYRFGIRYGGIKVVLATNCWGTCCEGALLPSQLFSRTLLL